MARPFSTSEELKRKLSEAGTILGYQVEEEFNGPPYTYDVIWREMEDLPPSHVFEVQDKGNVDSALARLQHAQHIWRPRLFLVVTGEKDKAKVEALLGQRMSGAFHPIRRNTTILVAEDIDSIHAFFSQYRVVIERFLGVGE